MAVNEREHLAQADRHIAECKAHVARHRELIWEIEQRGNDASWAEEMLQALEETLRVFEKHRQLIVDQLKDTSSRRPR
jgi:hypothetical protein